MTKFAAMLEISKPEFLAQLAQPASACVCMCNFAMKNKKPLHLHPNGTTVAYTLQHRS
jgi:hypothetical protein